METEKLYYSNGKLSAFTATVLECLEAKDGWDVVLDRTAFYPEGGGQPCDRGTLERLEVLDVQERKGCILHRLEQPLLPGTEVRGQVDLARRFDYAQQHTADHILTGVIHRRYGLDNVGFHMGADTVTIDYNAELTWQQVLAAEEEANRVIWADTPVEITYPSPAELEQLNYRSKKALTGQVRIVTFPGADCCACCGTHVLRAGQVGIIKVLSCQKFRSGVRMEILCGERAYRYLSGTYDQARAVGQQLSVKPLDAAAAVERLEAELTAAKARMTELEETVFFHKAQELRGKGDVLLVESPMRSDGVRKLADAVAKTCGGLSAVFSGQDGQFSYALVRADGTDVTPLVKTLNDALHGRGGGRGGFAQGSVQASEAEIRAFFNNPS